jgi:hypothetical protein
MARRALAHAVFLCVLAAAGCSAERPAPARAPADGVAHATSKAELLARTELGRKIGEIYEHNMVVGGVGPALTSSLMRGMAHTAHADATATPAARAAFVGSGASEADLIRPARRPIEKDTNYTELLYGYLAAIDPGGTVGNVEFYEDECGCETDLIARKGKDGVVRYYLVDSTGWHDTVFEELGETPDRRCKR